MAQAIIPAIMIAGGYMAYSSARQEGRAMDAAAKMEAGQLDQAANEQEGASQRAAAEQKRHGRLLQSRALAVAAASGAGAAGDKNVDDIVSGLEGESEYRSLTALYEGKSSANNLRSKGMVTRYQGREARRAADRSWPKYLASTTSSVSSNSSFSSKYGNAYSSSNSSGY